MDIQLRDNEWIWKKTTSGELEENIKELKSLGFSHQEISDKLGTSKSKVSRVLNKDK